MYAFLLTAKSAELVSSYIYSIIIFICFMPIIEAQTAVAVQQNQAE